jgi:hypothetical protein
VFVGVDSAQWTFVTFTNGGVTYTSDTQSSNQLGVLSSRISSVGFVDSYSGVTRASTIAGTGTYNAAIVKIATDASSNTLSNGDVVKTVLQQAKVKLTKNAKTSISAITLEKIGGSGSAVSAANNATASVITVTTDGVGGGDEATIAFKLNGYHAVAAGTCATGDTSAACAILLAAAIDGFTGFTAAAVGVDITVQSILPIDITDEVTVTGYSTSVVDKSIYTAFDTTVAGFATDDEIDNSSEVYYVIKVTIDSLESTLGNDWIQVDLDKLDGADGDQDADGANLKWQDGTDASAKYPLRLPSLNSVDGTKINEQS